MELYTCHEDRKKQCSRYKKKTEAVIKKLSAIRARMINMNRKNDLQNPKNARTSRERKGTNYES